MENQIQPQISQKSSDSGREWSMAKLTQLMRLVGGISLVGSGAVYMLYGLQHLSSFWRFMAFEALLVVCGALGIFCARRLGESKGARTLLALGAAGFPALMSQVGAMIYGMVHTQGNSPIPGIFLFSAGNWLEVILALVSALGLMTPLVFAGFLSLNREEGKQLALGFLASSALLLIPARQSFPVALMILAQVGLSAFHLWQQGKRGIRHMSSDRRYAMLLLMVPMAIVVGRSLFYPQSDFVVGAIFVCIAALGFAVSHLSARDQQVFPMLQFFSWVITWIGWAAIIEGIDGVFHLKWEWEAFLVVFPFYFIIRGLRSLKIVAINTLVDLTALALPLTGMVIGWDGRHPFVAQLVFLAGCLMSIDGFRGKNRRIFHLGALAALIGLSQTLFLAVEWLGGWSWLTLAVVGVGAIVLASFIESRAGLWKDHYRRYQAHWQQ